MLVKSWEQIPFATGVNNLREDRVHTELPFSISCGTQQGLEHAENSLGNQDAISLIIDNNYVIGVICDGCTSSDVKSVNEFTSNHVGANLLSKKTSSVIHNLIKSKGVKKISENLLPIQNELISFLETFTNQLSENEEERELVINNYLTTTIIAFAIDEEDYCMFNFGDGIAFANAKRKELAFSPGKYLSSYLENKNLPELGLSIIETGKTKTLNSIFISSDGFDNSKVIENKYFRGFIGKKNIGGTKGYFDGLPEFRKLFLTPFIEETEIFVQWPNDDATFILVKKVNSEQVRLPNLEVKPAGEISSVTSLEKFLLETLSDDMKKNKEEVLVPQSKEADNVEIILENEIFNNKENAPPTVVTKSSNLKKPNNREKGGTNVRDRKNSPNNLKKAISIKPKHKK